MQGTTKKKRLSKVLIFELVQSEFTLVSPRAQKELLSITFSSSSFSLTAQLSSIPSVPVLSTGSLGQNHPHSQTSTPIKTPRMPCPPRSRRGIDFHTKILISRVSHCRKLCKEDWSARWVRQTGRTSLWTVKNAFSTVWYSVRDGERVTNCR